MQHPFAPTAEKLKELTSKLSSCTYNAVFGRTLEERQRSTADAQALQDELDKVLADACRAALDVSSFLDGPRRGHGILQAATEFIQAVEAPRGAVDTSEPRKFPPSMFQQTARNPS